MEDIQSFKVDHTKLGRGLYVSRVDKVGLLSHATTFDLRMKKPYSDVPLKPQTAHAIEHCLATYLRNTRRDIIYAGPMGCLTGFYVVVSGTVSVGEIVGSLIGAFKYILEVEAVPGATKEQCGNCEFMDLPDAKREAEEYLYVLDDYAMKR